MSLCVKSQSSLIEAVILAYSGGAPGGGSGPSQSSLIEAVILAKGERHESNSDQKSQSSLIEAVILAERSMTETQTPCPHVSILSNRGGNSGQYSADKQS